MRRDVATVEYRECGLDNVVLQNVPVWKCQRGHMDVQVPAIDSLHMVIAKMLVLQPWPLRGQDVRFLRKLLGYSGRAFSKRLGLNHVTLSRFENARTRAPRRFEALVRLFCARALSERLGQAFPGRLLPVLEALEAERCGVGSSLHIEHVNRGTHRPVDSEHAWRQAAESRAAASA